MTRWIGLLLVCLLLATGCATSTTTARPEPPVVAIRNATGMELQNVSVREMPDRSPQPLRLGFVSPLLNGTTYTIRRRPNPAPLSDRVAVSWESRQHGRQTAVVSIREALDGAKGLPDEALIFHIMRDDVVVVSVDSLTSTHTGGGRR
jgi:hypothetical protein